MKKLFLAILALLLAVSIRSTEVYVCGWWFQEYICKSISDQEQEVYEETDPYTSSKSMELQDEHFLLPVESNVLSH